jgi:hypothetical protein
MKQLFLALAIGCICVVGSAQNRVTHMLSTSPSYTTKYNYLDEFFSTQYFVSPQSKLDQTLETGSKKSFYKFEIPIQYARELPNNFFLTLGYSRTFGEYNSTMTYYDLNVSANELQAIEEIEINGSTVHAGFGKSFYFSESKKFMLMPNMRAYFGGSAFDGSHKNGPTNGTNPIRNESYGYYLETGLTLGLQVNYQLSKHFGMGLMMNNMLGFEHLEVSNASIYQEDIVEGNFVLNLRQTPQLNLIYYFKGKSRDWVK